MPRLLHAAVPALGATALAVAGFVALLVVHLSGGGAVDLPWAPTLDLRLSFAVDGLGALYGMLATGIGALVFAYAARYLPAHLAHQGRPAREAWRFHGGMVLFMVAMVGLVTARDLLAIFLFWDLTAVASYLLIAFDRHERDSRVAALMALLVTGITAVALLIAALVLQARYGSFQLPDVLGSLQPGPATTLAGALVAVAGLAKCAQAPLHFWLPRAMTAPTPVSAYLHSAAMVAAGVFLLGRFHPLLQASGPLLDVLLGVGLLSIGVGGVLALTRDNFKQLLAYSTISQYGYVVAMLGLASARAALAASLYVVAHGLAKCALFLTAGAVTEAGGGKRLSDSGGMARAAPALAVGSALAAAGVAGLPLTIGFFADELFFAAALQRGPAMALAAVGAAALTVAYVARFWGAIFLGPRPAGAGRPSPALTAPVVALGALVALGGVWVQPFAELARAAGAATFGAPDAFKPAYHLDLRGENLMALGAYTLGGLLIATRVLWAPGAAGVARLGDAVGPQRIYELALRGLNALSDAVHDFEVRDLRARLRPILVLAAALVALGILATPSTSSFAVGTIGSADLPLALSLAVVIGAALACTVPREHLALVLVLSTLGFSLAVSYAFFGAPDVALVAVLVETTITLLFFGIFSLVPERVLRREARAREPRRRQRLNAGIAVGAGAFAFLVVWAALSRPAPGQAAAAEHVRLAPEAHGKDVVTVILADFRGLDTLVEITVVFVAVVGIATLLRRGRLA